MENKSPHILNTSANLLGFTFLVLVSVKSLGLSEKGITDLAQKPVRERLAEALLFLKETYGLEEDGSTLDVQLSREEIANIIGTATESAIRLISEFKQDGLIEVEGRNIKIKEHDKLRKLGHII